MPSNCPPGETKLFLVRSEPAIPQPSREIRDRLLDLLDNPLIPLALVFMGVIFMAGYLGMNGNWEGAKDFLCIFLPPISALIGAASAAYFRS
jgi:hypothetical protein